MALSEHEEKILTELETSLLQHDPRFVAKVSNVTLYARRRRRVRQSISGFTVGLFILLVFFTQSLPLGLVGLAMMTSACLVFARNASVARPDSK